MTVGFAALLDHVVSRAAAINPNANARVWSASEDKFLRENLGYMTDAEIGKALNRTSIAVHLRWSRDLHLPSPSMNPDVVTAHQAARILGIDSHKIANWVDVGIIPGRYMAGTRKIRLIRRISLMVWACSPKNWVYFDIKKVNDPHLKRLLELRAQRWDDEWWSTPTVAKFHGVNTGDVKRYILLGRLKSFRLPVSLGGRHDNRKWSNHFVLKSQAVKVKFIKRGSGSFQPHESVFTARADAWLLKARDELGMTFVHIGKTMKIGKQKVGKNGRGGTNPTIAYRYKALKAAQLQNGKRTRKSRD